LRTARGDEYSHSLPSPVSCRHATEIGADVASGDTASSTRYRALNDFPLLRSCGREPRHMSNDMPAQASGASCGLRQMPQSGWSCTAHRLARRPASASTLSVLAIE